MSRRQRRAAHRDARSAEKLRRAQCPADFAAAAYDEIRKTIAAEPVKADNRWKRFTQVLQEFHADLIVGDRR